MSRVKDNNVNNLLKTIEQKYGILSFFKLIDINHREDTAWYKTYYDINENLNNDDYKFNLPIPKQYIKDFYMNI